MGRLLTVALVLAAAAGAATVALGGVEPRVEKATASGVKHSASAASKQATYAKAVRRPVGATVAMGELTFSPARVTVRAGRAVRWVNHDDVDHLVYAQERAGNGAPDFASKRIRPGQAFTAAPSGPGTYRYVCTLHPTIMHGVVIVRG